MELSSRPRRPASAAHGREDRLQEQMLAIAAVALATVILAITAVALVVQERSAVNGGLPAAVDAQVRRADLGLHCTIGGIRDDQAVMSCQAAAAVASAPPSPYYPPSYCATMGDSAPGCHRAKRSASRPRR